MSAFVRITICIPRRTHNTTYDRIALCDSHTAIFILHIQYHAISLHHLIVSVAPVAFFFSTQKACLDPAMGYIEGLDSCGGLDGKHV